MLTLSIPLFVSPVALVVALLLSTLLIIGKGLIVPAGAIEWHGGSSVVPGAWPSELEASEPTAEHAQRERELVCAALELIEGGSRLEGFEAAAGTSPFVRHSRSTEFPHEPSASLP